MWCLVLQGKPGSNRRRYAKPQHIGVECYTAATVPW